MGDGMCGRAGSLTAVEQDLAIVIAADEVAATHHVGYGGQAVSVQGDDSAGRNVSMKDADAIVIEKQGVIGGRGQQSVERVRPGPGWCGRVHCSQRIYQGLGSSTYLCNAHRV